MSMVVAKQMSSTIFIFGAKINIHYSCRGQMETTWSHRLDSTVQFGGCGRKSEIHKLRCLQKV